MKSNRNSQDPSSNRKGGTPFWEKMQPKKKTSFERKTDPLERTKHRPVKHGAISKEKGWDQVAKWYDQLVGDEGSDYHKNIIVPAILERLGDGWKEEDLLQSFPQLTADHIRAAQSYAAAALASDETVFLSEPVA